MDIQKHIERAQEAVRKKNFDYAIALYHQVLAIRPDNGQARAELRQALSRKSEYSKLSPLVARLLALPQLLSVVVSKLSRNKESLIRACERYLQVDARSRFINLLLGRTLEEAGHLNSAAAVYEFIGQIDEKDTEALKMAGMVRYRLKDLEGALAIYEKVLALNPRDAEAEKMRKNLAAEGTLASGSYTTAGSSKELIKEKEEAAHLQRQTRIHKTEDEIEADIAHQEKLLAQNPGDKRALRELGELYLRKKDFTAAKVHYEKMIENDPDSFEIRCRIGDIDIRMYREEIDKLEERLKTEDSENLREDLVSLKKELLDKQVSEFAWRVKEHPTDLGLWYEYGQYVYRDGKIDEAIKAYQHAVKDPRYKIASMHMLGKSFFMKGLYDLAEKQLVSALEISGGVSEKTKNIAYDLGQVAEKVDNTPSAMDWYLKIYEIDINYKDVAEKIEKLKEASA